MSRTVLLAVVMVALFAPSARSVPGAGDERAVEFWTAELRADDPAAREAAARGLALSRRSANGAVPGLIDVLDDPEPAVRIAACDALAALRAAAAPAARPLAALLASEIAARSDVRDAAANALAQLGRRASAAVPDLVPALASDSEGVRVSAAEALGRVADREPSALAALETAMVRDPARRVRRAAHDALDGMGVRPAELVPMLSQALGDADPGVRRVAAEWLGDAPSFAGPAVEGLARAATSDDNREVRNAAADALAAMGPDASAAIPSVIASISAADAERRRAAARVLGRIGSGGQAEIELLARIVADDPELAVRQAARAAIVHIARRDEAAVRVLADLLASSDERLAVEAADTLGVLGDDAPAAVPALAAAVRSGPEPVRHAAVAALGQSGAAGALALPVLEQATQDRSERVRAAARRSIVSIRRMTPAVAEP